jgi:hypothetical protein
VYKFICIAICFIHLDCVISCHFTLLMLYVPLTFSYFLFFSSKNRVFNLECRVVFDTLHSYSACHQFMADHLFAHFLCIQKTVVKKYFSSFSRSDV